jgi:hypothetical protein
MGTQITIAEAIILSALSIFAYVFIKTLIQVFTTQGEENNSKN